MAWYDVFRRKQEAVSDSTASLEEILENYDLVAVDETPGNSFMVVSERSDVALKEKKDVLIGEIGSSSPSPFVSFSRNEYNSELQGHKGLEIYDRMRRSDGTTSGALRMIKTPVLAGRWFIEPASESKRDQNAADFVWDCLTKHMTISFPQLLTETLLMCDFGYYMFEKVWEERVIDGKERLVWSKLAPRHPMDVVEWKFDKHGGPSAVMMQRPYDIGNMHYNSDPIKIDIDKLLVFTYNREASNIEGISVLRTAYKHWFFAEQLYKIDAIQKERHGIGIPVIKLPPNFTQADKNAANQLGRNLRTNERAHVVLPPMWDLLFAKLEGNPVNAMESIEHHKEAIRENILATFMNSDNSTKEDDQTMFLKATRFIADIVCETFNSYAIPQLVGYNFERVGMPRLRARRIGESADWRTLSFAIRNLIGAGVLRPDDRLEAFIRDEMDLPKMDVATVRSIAAPQSNPTGNGAPTPGNTGNGSGAGVNKQSGAKVGLPRQGPPTANPIRPNSGIDRSGGK